LETPYEHELGGGRSAIRFVNRRIEAEYRAHLAHRSEINVRRQLLIGLVMLGGLTGLDFLLMTPAFSSLSLKIRFFAMVLPILATYSLTYFRRALWLRQLSGVTTAIAVALASLIIAEIGRRAGQPVINGGYFIVILFAYFFIGLRYPIAVFTSFTIVAIYIAVTVVAGEASANEVIYASFYSFSFAGICALGAGQLELARRRDFLNEHILRYRAGIDVLSGVANRAAFDVSLEAFWNEAVTQRVSLALLMVDIDQFKAYNDHYGHQAGDRAISRVAQVLKGQLRRPQDFVARYGGEEFAVILADISLPAALKMAEDIRSSVQNEAIEHEASNVEKVVTVSIGMALVEPYLTERSREGLVQIADQALYEAKSQGRNRVVAANAAAAIEKTGVFSLPNAQNQSD
jgi:diguanylate cyclase (GGDEF)-like protein